MEVFNLTLNQMLTMFILIIVGFVLRRKNIMPEESYVALSRLETYAFTPSLSIVTWIKNCNVKSLTENSYLILYGALIISIALLIAYLLAMIFVPHAETVAEKYQRNIYKYAFTFGNYGFLGNFLVLSIWGDQMLFKYSMLTITMSFICYSWGVIVLIPKDQGKVVSVKNMLRLILTPPTMGLLIGMTIGLTGTRQYIPMFIFNALESSSKCMGPVAMILAGFVIGGYNVGSLLKNKKVYFATAFRLVLIPGFIVCILKLIGANDIIVSLSLIVLATPFGMNTIVYPAAYGGDFRTGASMNMISSILSVITIPLMYLLFVVIL